MALKYSTPTRRSACISILSGIFLGILLPGSAYSATAGVSDLLSPAPPAELDIYSGYYNWNYQESAGDRDSAGMIPIRGRLLKYWGPLVFGADLGYEATFNGTYNGFVQTINGNTVQTTPYSTQMAETMFQGSGHLGGSMVFLGTRWDLWGSIGYHQQIWMTPAPKGYEEIYRIPYFGVNLYTQTPLTHSIVIFSEIGYRTALSPNVTIGAYDNPTLALGGATNFHSRLGGRYYITPRWGISLDMAYSNWTFIQSAPHTVPNQSPQISLQEPDSSTTWWGPEIGVVFNF